MNHMIEPRFTYQKLRIDVSKRPLFLFFSFHLRIRELFTIYFIFKSISNQLPVRISNFWIAQKDGMDPKFIFFNLELASGPLI